MQLSFCREGVLAIVGNTLFLMGVARFHSHALNLLHVAAIDLVVLIGVEGDDGHGVTIHTSGLDLIIFN